MCKANLLQTFDSGIRAPTALSTDVIGETVAIGSYYTSDVASISLSSGRLLQTYHCDVGTTLGILYVRGRLHCISKQYPELCTYLVDLVSGQRTELLAGKNFDATACVYPHRIALSWGRQIVVANLEDLTVIDNLRGHKDSIDSLAFSKSGRLLASTSADRTVRIWDVNKLKCLRTIKLREARSVAFSPDGDLLAIGRTAGQIDLWRLDQDRRVSVGTDSDCAIGAICFGEQGKRLYSTSWDGKLSIWDIQL